VGSVVDFAGSYDEMLDALEEMGQLKRVKLAKSVVITMALHEQEEKTWGKELFLLKTVMTLPIWMSMLSCGKYTKTEKKYLRGISMLI
jgi:hypothetical protein